MSILMSTGRKRQYARLPIGKAPISFWTIRAGPLPNNCCARQGGADAIWWSALPREKFPARHSI